MATWGLEDSDAILAAAVAEVDWLGLPDFDDVRRAADGAWTAPAVGIGLDAAQTAAAVTHVIHGSADAAEAMTTAVLLGGDTDTVAAIVGGILGGAGGQNAPHWWGQVSFPENAEVDDLAGRLAGMRRDWYVE